MQSKKFSKPLAICLLAISQAILNPSFAIADKEKSIVLTPKWSLPFQGQLGNALQGNAAAPKEELVKDIAKNPANELAIFKAKKVQVLTISPPEPLSQTLIADASTPELNTVADTIKQNGKFIAGEISVWDGPFDGDRIVNHLLESHFENSPEGKKLDQQVKIQSGFGHKSFEVARDGINELIEYQGTGPSMRAGQLILDSPKCKTRNKAWADYSRQRYIDKIHGQVVTCLMQLAEGIGNSENEQGTKAIAGAKEELTALVGSEEAQRAVKALTIWLNNIQVPYATFAQAPWTTSEHVKKLEQVVAAAIEHDPVITEVTKRVERYAYPNALKHRSSQLIQTALNGVTIFSPGAIVSIAAGTAEVGYKLASGGSEETKLEKELLLDKRIQSRLKVLGQEASLALDNYRYAMVTKNPPLLAFSQEVIENLTGKTDSVGLISSSDVPVQDYDNTNTMVPEMKSEMADNKKQSTVKSMVRSVKQMAVCADH